MAISGGSGNTGIQPEQKEDSGSGSSSGSSSSSSGSSSYSTANDAKPTYYYFQKPSLSATLASGFSGFKSKSSGYVFYKYSSLGVTARYPSFVTGTQQTEYSRYSYDFPAWVKPLEISDYTSGRSPLASAIKPGTLPQFGECYSSAVASAFTSNGVTSFLTQYNVTYPSSTLNQFTVTRYNAYMSIMGSIIYPASRKDGALPETVFVLMVGGGGGGGGAGGGINPADTNKNGSGGGAGASALFALNLGLNETYSFSVGCGGEGGAGWNNGADGGATTLSVGGKTIVSCGGGHGGEHNGLQGYGGSASFSSDCGDYLTRIYDCDGGMGGKQTTGTASSIAGSGNSNYTYGISGVGTYPASGIYFLETGAGIWTAGAGSSSVPGGHIAQYAAPGGGSRLANGGSGGDNSGGTTTGELKGGDGVLGSGGGGGRFLYSLTTTAYPGGSGGDGLVMIFF